MNIEESTLIQKYEMLLYKKQSIYFDLAEFDIIISYYIYEGQYLDALEALVYADTCHPESSEMELYKVKILICLEDYDKALELVQQLEDKFPELYEINIYKGQIYLAYDDIDSALTQFGIALDKNPDPDMETCDIPDLLIEQNYFEEALLFLHKFIDDKNADSLTYYQAAFCYDKLSKFEEAEEFYEKSLDEDPFDDKTWIALGILCLNMENWDKSLQSFEFALSIDENNYVASLCKANALIQINDYDAAIDCIMGILEKMPNDANTLYCLGGCYERKHNIPEAEKCYIKAIEQEPDFSLPYWGLSKILYNQHDFEGAIKALDKALEFEPANDEYIYFRGQCLINLISNKNILNSLLTNMAVSDELPNEYESKQKQAIFFYEIGDFDQCCKLLLDIVRINNRALDTFFELYPDAKEDSYIINYIGKYLK